MIQAAIPSPTMPLEGTREADTKSTMPFSPLVRLVLVFLIRGKILKSGSRVTEKRNPGNPVFFGFWNECDFERLNKISLWNYYCWYLRNLLANY